MRTILITLFLSITLHLNAQEAYVVLSNNNQTLTFYFDNQMSERGGSEINITMDFYGMVYTVPSWQEYCGGIKKVV